MFKRFYNHKQLNPRIWYPDGTMRPVVEDILNRVFISYMTMLSAQTEIPLDIDKDVIDILLGGSSVNYHYGKNSDFDILIIIRPNRYLDRMNVLMLEKMFKMLGKIFRAEYKPEFIGMSFDVACMIMTEQFPNKPKYSLLNRRWIIKPNVISDAEFKQISKRAKLYYLAMIKKFRPLLRNRHRVGEYKWMYNKLNQRRGKSWQIEPLACRNPYSLGFSMMKNSRVLKVLKKRHDKLLRQMMFNPRVSPA